MSRPPSRHELDSMIASALAGYDDAVHAEWGRIRIDPEKWRCSPWGDHSGGFWVVAIDGDRALWFNDVEEGFNWSRYSTRGTIDEYLCNETELVEILEAIAQQQSEHARARVREGDVPANLVGPGRIVSRQTTYWDVRAAAGATYRIHFRNKVEFVFASAEYPNIEVTDQHPLLVDYDAPLRSLYFSGTPLRSRAVAENIDRGVRDVSQGWRTLHDYAGDIDVVERQLRAGHGMLMSAPQPVCAVAARLLEDAGVQCEILGSAAPRVGKRALLLERNYVVASGFAFDLREAS